MGEIDQISISHHLYAISREGNMSRTKRVGRAVL